MRFMGVDMCELHMPVRGHRRVVRLLGVAPLAGALLLGSVLHCASVSAGEAQTAARDEVHACLLRAAEYHRVDADLLHAIATVESGLDPRALNQANADGSRDIGLMQINSSWLPRLARWSIREQDLFDPCISAYVGAWILADNIRRHGPVWRAVGAYNARTPERQLRYVARVRQQLARLRAASGSSEHSASQPRQQ